MASKKKGARKPKTSSRRRVREEHLDRVIRFLNLTTGAEELNEALVILGSEPLDDAAAEALLRVRAITVGLSGIEDVRSALTERQVEQLDVLGSVTTDELLGRLSKRDGLGASVRTEALPAPALARVPQVPGRQPVDASIPEYVTWRAGNLETAGRPVDVVLANGCMQRRQRYVQDLYGPFRYEEEGPMKTVVLLHLTGSTAFGFGGQAGPFQLGGQHERPTFDIVLQDLCLQHVWQLRSLRYIVRVFEACPPDFTYHHKSDTVASQAPARWFQAPSPRWPIPCGQRTVAQTDLRTFKDDAKAAAAKYGVKFFDGALADVPFD
jgi:hypothetical protein